MTAVVIAAYVLAGFIAGVLVTLMLQTAALNRAIEELERTRNWAIDEIHHYQTEKDTADHLLVIVEQAYKKAQARIVELELVLQGLQNNTLPFVGPCILRGKERDRAIAALLPLIYRTRAILAKKEGK